MDTVVAAVAAVEAEGVIREFERAQPILSAVVAERIYIGAPSKLPVDVDGKLLPHLTLHLVAARELAASATPGVVALVQHDCYGRTRADAAAVATAVLTLALNMRGHVVIADGVHCGGAAVRRWQFMPDPASNRPRYSLDVEFTILGRLPV